MLKNIEIKGFKSIESEKISLEGLTLLVGPNSAGKSSIIQSILISLQAINNYSNHLKSEDVLNGSLISVGDFLDVRNNNLRLDQIEFIINDSMCIDISEENVSLSKIDSSDDSEYEDIKNKLKFRTNLISYISAQRIGGRDVYEKKFGHHLIEDFFGEYIMVYYEQNKRNMIDNKKLIHAAADGVTLDLQLNYWLDYIVGAQLYTENILGSDLTKAMYQDKNDTQKRRPKNVGSGISYLVSILILILSAKKNTTVIIENPEIHLHPGAQSKLSELFCYAANAGVNLIIETHSDHIFNGIRKAIKKDIIDNKTPKIYFVDNTQSQNNKVVNVDLSEKGRILTKIPGLFDQFNLDLNEMLGI